MHLFWNMISWVFVHAVSKRWHDSAAWRKKMRLHSVAVSANPLQSDTNEDKWSYCKSFYHSGLSITPRPGESLNQMQMLWGTLEATGSFLPGMQCHFINVIGVLRPNSQRACASLNREVAAEFTDLFFPINKLDQSFLACIQLVLQITQKLKSLWWVYRMTRAKERLSIQNYVPSENYA